jgi:hypothetical protein
VRCAVLYEVHAAVVRSDVLCTAMRLRSRGPSCQHDGLVFVWCTGACDVSGLFALDGAGGTWLAVLRAPTMFLSRVVCLCACMVALMLSDENDVSDDRCECLYHSRVCGA